MLSKVKVTVLGALAAVSLAGVLAQGGGNRIDAVRPDAPALAAYGKHAVGVRTLRLVNAGQVDVLKARPGEPNPTYDRPLTVEVWYPATLPAGATGGGEYRTVARDGRTEVRLLGRAVRDAAPDAGAAPYPLVIVSHGYPGNRFLLSHLGENLASKGYVVASIDHTDSTYSDQGAFGSTLLNRPLDQLFVLNEMARLGAADTGGLKGMVDAEATALVGYSMGGYGVLNALGAGFTAASVKLSVAPPNDLLARRQAGNPAYPAAADRRVKAAIAIAPWGYTAGFWDAAGLAGLRTPTFFIAGSLDDVAGYQPGVRSLFEGAVNADRYLLTFVNANHNAAAPIPAPQEVSAPGSTTFSHYGDAVWDTVRMNNIAQHFATAFLDKHLKNDASMDAYLQLVENAADGKWSVEANGTPRSDHTYWRGFANRTAVGLTLQHRTPAP